MTSAIAYYRVSTARQGKSGLGIEAQKAAVHRFADAEGIVLIGQHDDGTFRLASLRKRAAKLWTAIESVSALPGLDLNVNVLPILCARSRRPGSQPFATSPPRLMLAAFAPRAAANGIRAQFTTFSPGALTANPEGAVARDFQTLQQ
jgi:hypothetical protein